MKKGIKNFCNGDDSTSTLNQLIYEKPESNPTLEEMILQLEIEEEIARKEKLRHGNEIARLRGRMSCVDNSDILRSARNALNQYPRFSLDGKDAMYRSSFRNDSACNAENPNNINRRSVCLDYGGFCLKPPDKKSPKFGGENVIWCKPGVIAKLMGLEAMPVPVNCMNGRETLSCIVKRQNLRRRADRHEIDRKIAMNMVRGGERMNRRRSGGFPAANYCVMKPFAVEHTGSSVGS